MTYFLRAFEGDVNSPNIGLNISLQSWVVQLCVWSPLLQVMEYATQFAVICGFRKLISEECLRKLGKKTVQEEEKKRQTGHEVVVVPQSCWMNRSFLFWDTVWVWKNADDADYADV